MNIYEKIKNYINWRTITKELININENQDIKITTINSEIENLYLTVSQAIANLSSAHLSLKETNIPSIPIMTTTNQELNFTTVVDSNDLTKMTIDDTANTITFLKDVSYNFMNSITFESLSGGGGGSGGITEIITFDLINDANDQLINSISAEVNIKTNTSIIIPLNILLTIGSNGIPASPLTLRFEARATSLDNISLKSFNSILAS